MKNNIYNDNEEYAIRNSYDYRNNQQSNKHNNYQDSYTRTANYDRNMQYGYYDGYDNNLYITEGNDYFNEEYDYINYEYAYDDTMNYDDIYFSDEYNNQKNHGSSYDSGRYYQNDYKNGYDDIELRQLSVSINQDYGLGNVREKDFQRNNNSYQEEYDQKRNNRLKEYTQNNKPEYKGRVYPNDYGYSEEKNHNKVNETVSKDDRSIQFEDMFIINSQYFEEDEDEKLISLKDVINLFVCMVLAFVLAFMIVEYVAQHTEVDGQSMDFNYHDHDILIIDKLSYRLSEPKRFDVVVFPIYDGQTYYIKRIIGLPGETVSVTDESNQDGNMKSKIFINGEEVKEDFGFAPYLEWGTNSEMTLGEDEYFVMGDNRNNSKDSRNDQVGFIKREDIMGKAIFRVYPFDRFGIIDNTVNCKIKQGDTSLAVDGEYTIEDF